MRPLSTFTALLLSSTVLVSVAAHADSSALQTALAGTDSSITLSENQELTADQYNAINRNFTINGMATGTDNINGTNIGYGIVGSIMSGDASETEASTLTVNNVGQADVNLETYTVSLTNVWRNGSVAKLSDSLPVTDTDGNIQFETGKGDQQALRIDGNAAINSTVFAESAVNGAGGAIVVTGLGVSQNYNPPEENTATKDDATATEDEATVTVTPSRPDNDTSVKITNSLFYDNIAREGAAIDYDTPYAKGEELSGNYFIFNRATNHGGALDVHSTLSNVNSNDFVGNIAVDAGGAMYVHNGGKVTGKANRFYDNVSSVGGAVYVEGGGNVSLEDSIFYQNSTFDRAAGSESKKGLGGAIYNANGSTVTLTGQTTFSENQSGNYGGAIYNEGILNLSGSGITFIDNSGGIIGHDIYNTVDGVVTLDGVVDDIDKTGGHVTFDTAGGLENLGTFNFKNSQVQLHQGMNTSTGKQGIVSVNNSTIDLGDTNRLYADTVTIENGSTVQTHVKTLSAANPQSGAVEANTINVNGDNTLKVIVDGGKLDVGQSRDVTVLDATTLSGDFTTIGLNKLYDITANGDGTYKITRTQKASIGGCDDNECSTAIGWLDGEDEFEEGTLARDVYDKLNELAQDGDCTDEEYQNALDAIAPDVSPLIRSHITEVNRRLYSIISNRLYSSMERTGYIYRNKRYYRFPRNDSHVWAQGIYSQAKYDVRKGFDGNEQGIAFGFDGHVNEALRMGIGYSYTQGDYDSIQRKTDIDSHTGMFYGEYNPNRFFVNWLATYTRSSFSEDKNVAGIHVNADYDVDAIGAQVMLGQKMGPYVNGNWSTGVFMPEVGLRYLYTKQGDYTDTASQQVSGAKGSSLTGILGLQYTIGYALSPNISWYPELRAAVTYDIMEPDMDMQVNLLNGNVYEVKEESMDRLGFELGGRVGLDINRTWEMSLEYEGVYRGDYTNHTGLANVKYKF